jgi:hypothetical protein
VITTIRNFLTAILAACALVITISAQTRTAKDPDRQPQIEGIYTNSEYGVGYGGMSALYYVPYVLFKDGTIYSNLAVSPYDLNVKRSRQSEPKLWGRWQKSGKNIIVRWNSGSTETWVDYLCQTPARKTDRLQGVYNSMMGGGNIAYGGSVGVSAISSIRFSADGRFSVASSASASAPGVATSSRSKTIGGAYILDGYSIELRYDDGRVERKGFYFCDNGHKLIGIGNRTYLTRK